MATSDNIQPTKQNAVQFKLNDIGFRLILIPFFGIAIPLITGMINIQNFSHWKIKLSFLYTILIAFLVWQGNRYLLFSLRSYFNWHKKPLHKIAILLLSISFYTIPLSVLMLTGWYKLFTNGEANSEVVFTSTLIIMICVIFITHVYETAFLVKESESEMVRNEQLERAKAEAELEALKNQIDPHFIFNSLNTLSHLIEEKPGKAKLFNDSLADVYRYILHNKGRELVLLQEEMAFLNDYFSLIKIRFENAVQLINHCDESIFQQFLIPPISLQVLIENAIKHNEFTDNEPLIITINSMNDYLVVQNDKRVKELRKESSKIGLQNLKERYRLVANKEISIVDEEKKFTVTIPILPII
ncbi:MAG: histidine kinase [Chitinophagaceae bacterium]